MTIHDMGARAKAAARVLANAGSLKETALLHAAGALWQRREEILSANALDLAAGREAGMSQALLDRLALTESRVQGMSSAVEQVAKAADPVGKVLSGQTLANGLRLEKVTVPLGVIGIIYEARPNVTSDAAALCLKAGNAVILRGGPGRKGPPRGQRSAGGGHFPPVRPGADGSDGLSGRTHPPGRGGADPLCQGKCPGAGD